MFNSTKQYFSKAALFFCMTVLAVIPAQKAEALDALSLTSINGTWDITNLTVGTTPGANNLSPPCFITGEADPISGPITMPAQSAVPASENQWRWNGSGQPPCEGQSGQGFVGITQPPGTVLGSAPFQVGTLTHYNVPVDLPAGSTNGVFISLDLLGDYTFQDLTSVVPSNVPFSIIYDVNFHETPNGANPCAYVGPGIDNSNGCADRTEVIAPSPPPTATIGGTLISIDVNQFFPLDGNGNCDLTAPTTNAFFSPEDGSTTGCAFGVGLEGDLILNKVAVGGDATFEFRQVELSQVLAGGDIRGQETGTPIVTPVVTAAGVGQVTVPTIPGIIKLEEQNLPAGWEFESRVCVDPDEDFGPSYLLDPSPWDSQITLDTQILLDMDSVLLANPAQIEQINCTFVNRKNPTITIIKNGLPIPSAQSFNFTTTSTLRNELTTGVADPGTLLDTTNNDSLPASFALTANGGTQSFEVDPGTFTVTEDSVASWELTDLTCSTVEGANANDQIASATGDVATGAANITVGWGDEVICTYENTFVQTLTLEKAWVNGVVGHTAALTAEVPGVPGQTLNKTYRDDFSPDAFNNSDGTEDWSATPWVETNDPNNGGNPVTTGDMEVDNGVLELDFSQNNQSMSREIDLSTAAAAGSSVTLTFNWNETGGTAADTMEAQLWNGATWDTIFTHTIVTGSNPNGSVNHNLTAAQISGSSAIRFISTSNWEGNDDVEIDNLLFAWQEITLGTPANTGTATSNAPAVPAAGNSASISIVAGDVVNLSEVLSSTIYDTTLTCTDGSLTYAVGATTGSLDTSGATGDIICTFTNTQIVTPVTLTKIWEDGITDDAVSLVITNASGLPAAAAGSSIVGGATVDATASALVGDVLTLTEAFTTGADTNYTKELTCTSPTQVTPQIIAADALTGNYTVVVGDVSGPIACTFTNTQIVTPVTLTKIWEDGITDDAVSLVITNASGLPAAAAGSSIVGGASTNATASALVGDVLTLTEAFTTGADTNYTKELMCTSPTQVTPQIIAADALTGNYTVVVGDVSGPIACTFTNTQIVTPVTLTKIWEDGITDDAVSLVITNASGLPAAAAGSSIVGGATVDATASALVGDVLTLTEAFTTGADTNYTKELTCTSPTQVTPQIIAADALTGNYTVVVGDVSGPIACTFTNTQIVTPVTLTKIWEDGITDDAVSLVITNASGLPAAAAGSSIVGGATVDATASALVGDVLTLTEAFTTGADTNYTKELTCTSPTQVTPQIIAADALTGNYTVVVGDVSGPIACTFTNTQIVTPVTLTKIWEDGITDDAVSLVITNASGLPAAAAGSSIVGGATVDATASALVGDVLTLTEAFTTGADTNYTKELTCTSPTQVTPQIIAADALTGNYTVVVGDVSGPIACTFTNTQIVTPVTLTKIWEDGITDDAVSLVITNASGLPAAAAGSSIVGGASANATASALVGDVLTLTEAFTTGADTNYTKELTCTSPTQVTPQIIAADALTGNYTVVVGDVSGPIACTFTNTQIVTPVTLTKIWEDGITDDAVSLVITNASGLPAAAAGSSIVGGATVDATASALVGDVLTLTEAFTTGADTNYTKELTCTSPTQVTPQIIAADALTGNYTVVVGDVSGPIACTFTNTQIVTPVTLTKIWEDGITDDAVSLVITNASGLPAAAAGSSIVGGASANATASALVGDVLTLTEAFTTGADTNYTKELTCTSPTQVTPQIIAADALTGDYTVVVGDVGGPIACTFTNTRKSAPLVLTKVWSAAFDGDAVDLTISGGLNTPTAGVNSNDGDSLNDTDATTTVLAGETLSLVEAFTTGDATDYDSTLTCTAGTLTYVLDALTGSLLVEAGDLPTAGPITCTYTNTGVSDVEIAKSFVSATDSTANGGTANDGIFEVVYTVTVSNSGGGASMYDLVDSPSFSPGLVVVSGSGTVTGGPTSPTAVYPGANPWVLATAEPISGTADPATPAEHVYTITFVVDATALNATPTDYDVCSGATGMAGEGLFNQATLTVDAVDTPAEDCGDIPVLDIQKFVGGTTDLQDGTYLVAYILQVSNYGGAIGTYDLDDELTPAVGVTITDVTDLTQNNDDDGTGMDPAPNAGFNGVADTNIITGETIGVAGVTPALDTYSYTVTYTVDANSYNDAGITCTETNEDVSVVNTATLSTGDEDDACTDLPALTFDKVGVATDNGDGTFALDYTLTVTNNGKATGTYDLDDQISLAAGVTVDSVTSLSQDTDDDGVSLPAVNVNFNGDLGLIGNPPVAIVADANVIDNEEVGPGLSDVYTYTVVYRVDPDLIDPTGNTCPGTQLDVPVFNVGTLSTGADDDDCQGFPALTVDKAAGTIVDNHDGTYTVPYTLTVMNNGTSIANGYELNDTITAGSGVSISLVTVGTHTEDGSDMTMANPSFDGVADTAITQIGENLDAMASDVFTYTVLYQIDPTAVVMPATGNCATTPGEYSVPNIAVLSTGDEDESCIDLPAIQITKLAGMSVDNSDGTYTVPYTVTATNVGAALKEGLVINDTIAPGNGITTFTVAMHGHSDDGSDAIDVNAGFMGSGANTELTQAGENVAAGASDVFTYVVTYTVDPTLVAPALGICTGTPGSFSVENQAVSDNGQMADECVDLPAIKLTKVAGAPVDIGNDMFMVLYTVTAENVGGALKENLVITDTITPGNGITGFTVAMHGHSDDGSDAIDVNAGFMGSGANTELTQAGENVAAGASDVFTYVVTYTVNPALVAPALGICTGTPGSFSVENQAVSDNGQMADECVDLPAIKLTKVAGAPIDIGNDMFTVLYTVTAENVGGASKENLVINDTITPGNGITGFTVASHMHADDGSDGAIINAGFNGAAVTTLTSAGENLAAGGSDVFTYVVTYTVDPTLAQPTAGVCTGTPGSFSVENEAVSDNGQMADECVDLPAIKLTKVAGAPIDIGNDMFTVLYTVTAENVGGALKASLVVNDTITPGNGITGFTVASHMHTDDGSDGAIINAGFNGAAVTTLTSAGEDLAAGASDVFTYVVTYTVDPTLAQPTAGVCTGTPGSFSVENEAVSDNGQMADECVDLPAIKLTKVAGAPIDIGNDMFTVLYTVTAENVGGALKANLVVNDTITPGNGITGFTVASHMHTDDGSDGAIINAGFNGAAVTTLTSAGENLAAGGSDVFTYVVTYTVDPTLAQPTAGVCTGTPGSFSVENEAVSDNGQMADECVDLPAIKLTKVAGAPVDNSNGTYTVLYTVTAENVGGGLKEDLVINDTITPGNGITGFTVASHMHTDDGSDGAIINAGFNGAAVTTLTSAGEDLAAGASDIFTYEATYTVDLMLAAPTTGDCTGTPGSFSVENQAISDNGQMADECVDLPQPIIDLKKEVKTPPVRDVTTGYYTVVYDVTATNSGEGYGIYDIIDTAKTGGDGIQVVSLAGYEPTIAYVGGEVQTGTITPAPLLSAMTWVLDEGLAAGASESWDVTMVFSVNPALLTIDDRDCIIQTGEMGTGFANRVDGSITDPDLTNNEACVEVPESPVTPITLGWFKSSELPGGQLWFEWTSATEVANLGYYLWSENAAGDWIQLNQEVIASQGDSLGIQRYEYTAFGVEGNTFRITDIGVSGKLTHHGPFELGLEYGVFSERKDTDWNTINEESERKSLQREQQRRNELERRLQQFPSQPENQTMNQTNLESPSPAVGLSGLKGLLGRIVVSLASVLINTAEAEDFLNFSVGSAGIYRVTYQQMKDAGLDLNGRPVSLIGLKERGSLVPIKITPATGNFGPGSTIEFVGQPLDTIYSGDNIYTLALGESQELIVSDDGVLPPGEVAYSYLSENVYAPQNKYTYSGPDLEDAWYAEELSALDHPVETVVDLYLDDHAPARSSGGFGLGIGGFGNTDDRTSASVKPKLAVELWGKTTLVERPDHHVVIELNGAPAMDIRFDGIRVHQSEKVLARVLSGTNQIKVKLPRDNGWKDSVYLDRLTLSYPRQFKAKEAGRSLVFPSSWNKFTVRDLASTDVTVYQSHASGQVTEVGSRADEDCYGTNQCRVTFGSGVAESDDSVFYVATTGPNPTTNGIKTPIITIAAAYEDLFSGPAAGLIIAHPDFITPDLEGYRQDLEAAYGDSVDIVSVESIYAQYSGHVLDADAIQTYIQAVYKAPEDGGRNTRRVTLVGGDVYDYRDYLKTGSRSFVPSKYVRLAQNLNSIPSDAAYADIDGDYVPDIEISRLPVRKSEELGWLLAKRQSYLSSNYAGKGKVVFAAGKEDSGYNYKSKTQALIADHFSASNGWTSVATAYQDDIGAAGANQVISDQINGGVSLTSYMGHSDTDRWTFNGLLRSEDVSVLNNASRPTIVTQWGCWSTFYVDPQKESLAQRLLIEGEHGAAVVMGATSLTLADAEGVMADLVFERLSSGMRIGEAVLSAKQTLAASNPYQLDILLGWTVLGPADIVISY